MAEAQSDTPTPRATVIAYAPPPAAAPVALAERILALDVLRGFALFGIIIVNMAGFSSPL